MNYENYHQWKKWNSDQFGAYSREEAAYFEKEFRNSGISEIQGKAVLEIGFGNGGFGGWVISKGVNYYGTEIIDDLLDLARSKSWYVVHQNEYKTSVLNDMKYDLIVAFDVLEHIPIDELTNLFAELKCNLAANGMIIARIPSGDSPFSRAIQYGDLTHRSILGSSAIKQIGYDLGYKSVLCREPANPIMGLGFIRALRRGAVNGVQKMIYWFIRNFLMNNKEAIVSPNMIIEIRN